MFNARHDWVRRGGGQKEYRTFAVDALTPHICAVYAILTCAAAVQ